MQRSLRHWARRVIQPDIFTHRVFVLHGQHGLVYALELGGERNRIKLTALWSFTHCTFNFIVDVWPCDGARCLLQFKFKWLLLITYWNNLSEAAHTRLPDHQNTSSYSPSSSSLPLISVTTHSSQSDVGQEDAATSQELRLLSQLSHYPGPNCPP